MILTPVVLVCNDEYWLPYALEASKGVFKRYVIYDVGSTDRTRDIITWFVDTNKGASYYVCTLPMLPPVVQGRFRNSMIAEAMTEYYFILDGDEVYTPESYEGLVRGAEQCHEKKKLYGVVERIEVDENLKKRYIHKRAVPHHRIYHRNAIWTGNHPGEVPYFKQEPSREHWVTGPTCYHFHNAERSSKDAEVPKRLERRGRATYRPGELIDFNLLETLPILKRPIADFAVNPRLAELQSGSM